MSGIDYPVKTTCFMDLENNLIIFQKMIICKCLGRAGRRGKDTRKRNDNTEVLILPLMKVIVRILKN